MRREIRKRIIDYSENKGEIEKWLGVKGEEKYSQFADMLDAVDHPITWDNISQLYRYDKRLLINSFRYLSFFEEYVRVIIINNSEDPHSRYLELQDEGMFGQLPDQLLRSGNIELKNYFDSMDPINDLRVVNTLRRAVAHNKIILQMDDCEGIFKKFSTLIPKDFRNGFIKDVNNCVLGMKIPEAYVICI